MTDNQTTTSWRELPENKHWNHTLVNTETGEVYYRSTLTNVALVRIKDSYYQDKPVAILDPDGFIVPRSAWVGHMRSLGYTQKDGLPIEYPAPKNHDAPQYHKTTGEYGAYILAECGQYRVIEYYGTLSGSGLVYSKWEDACAEVDRYIGHHTPTQVQPQPPSYWTLDEQVFNPDADPTGEDPFIGRPSAEPRREDFTDAEWAAIEDMRKAQQ